MLLSTQTALVIGATGGIGGEAVAALIRHGWSVRALTRRTAPPAWPAGIDWIQGDAMDPAAVAAAARGVSLIVHAANPPGYRNWRKLVPAMLESTIAAAIAEGARIILPGTIYNFGPDAFPLLAETSTQRPNTRKGRIRVAMEARLRQASTQGARVLIVRAGDFFGPRPGNSWLSQGMIKPGAPVRAITEPVRGGAGHAWAYLPDVAETMAALMDREAELEDFAVFHFGGHWFDDGRDFARAVALAAGDPRIPIRAFPWPVVVALSPLVPLFREMAEMRYLWKEPIRLDNRRLRAFLGREPHTPLDEALGETLDGLGCLAPPASASLPLGRAQTV
jgi:nucleoside-diphosphate-sugar epimerase